MTYAQLEYYVSQPRLNRFLRACGNSKSKTQKLYKINLRVAQAFYPLMNLFETFIRNEIYNELTNHFNDPDWIINQKRRFMSDPSLSASNFFLKTSALKAEQKIRRASCQITSSKIIAEHPFGFWTAFFDPHHFKLVQGAPLGAFPNKPNVVNRSTMTGKLNRIREFRNRIYHNEPICFRGSSIDFLLAKTVIDDIHDIMEWINPSLKTYTDYFNNINSKIEQASGL
jgi:hypothetical protein